MRPLIAVAGVVLLAGTSAHGQALDRRQVSIRDLRLRSGDVLTVALHPSTTPIELTARGLDLEACPGTWDGTVATSAASSWPSSDGFTECRPFTDDELTLPSARFGGGAMHLVFAVRALADGRGPGVLNIAYEPVDGFFTVAPPAVASGARSPSIRLTATGHTVSAGATAYTTDDESADLRDVSVAVRQRGRVVRAAGLEDARSAWPSYGPVEPGEPVTVRARNRGADALRFAIGLDVL